MKSRTIVKNVAQNSGGRSVKVLFFSVQYDCCNHLKKVFRIFFADLLLFSELELVCSIISVEAGPVPVCKSTVV